MGSQRLNQDPHLPAREVLPVSSVDDRTVAALPSEEGERGRSWPPFADSVGFWLKCIPARRSSASFGHTAGQRA